MSVRRHELDWLRVMAILMLVVYHSGRVFDQSDFYVKNPTLSQGMQVFIDFVGVWAMPLFFFIAGAAAWFALQKRTRTEFVSERVKRLLLPLLLGILLIVPPQLFCVYVQKAGNPHSYLSFYRYLFSVPPFTQITAGHVGDAFITGFTWEMGHLWFVFFLIIFSLVTLPFFLSLKQGRWRNVRLKLANQSERRGWLVFLFAIPFMAVFPLALQAEENVARFMLVIPFVVGFLFYSDERFGRAVERHLWKALAGAVMFSGVLGALSGAGLAEASGGGVLLFGGLAGLDCWLWMLAIVGLARRKLNFSNRVLEYASEASYPFYILHQTVIVALALGIVQLEAALALKYLLLVIVSFGCTAAIYELLVRRWDATRFLLGMKPLERQPEVEPPQVA